MTFSDNFFSDLFSTNLSLKCEWLPANQFLFQLANIFLIFTYFVKPNGLVGLVQLRIALTLAGLCFGIWGGAVICSFDCMLWNSAFAVGNALHLVYLFVKLRPKKFEHDQELIYQELFKSVGVKRFQYQQLINIVDVSEYEQGEYYALQGSTKSDHIGILVKGSFEVILEGRSLSHVTEYEFLDSPEWLSMNEQCPTTFQVSLVANETSKVFQWEKKKLIRVFKKDEMIKNIFDLLIGKDICKKLFSLHQTFLMQDKAVVREELKQASLLTYSAANLHVSHLFSPLHLPLCTAAPTVTDRSPQSITFDGGKQQQQQQHHQQQQHQQQRQQQREHYFSSNSDQSALSSNESRTLLNSSTSPKTAKQYGRYSYVDSISEIDNDTHSIVIPNILEDIDNSENQLLLGSKMNDNVADRFDNLLYRETDL